MPETAMERILREARAEQGKPAREPEKKAKPKPKKSVRKTLANRGRDIDAIVDSAVRGEVEKLKDRQTTDKNN